MPRPGVFEGGASTVTAASWTCFGGTVDDTRSSVGGRGGAAVERQDDRPCVIAASGRCRSGAFVAPACCCACHGTVVGGCLIHAAQCAGAFSSSGGTMAVHAASLAGCGQRGWKTQPDGGFAGE